MPIIGVITGVINLMHEHDGFCYCYYLLEFWLYEKIQDYLELEDPHPIHGI